MRPPKEIAEQLKALGVRENGVVMVHASLRRLGPVSGGATGVIEAIRGAIGDGGTMTMMISADDEAPFDRLETEADEDNGVLAEEFRVRPGVVVSDHVIARFAAWGPNANEITRDAPLHHYFGPGSPLEWLCEMDADILRLGADPETVTMTHYAEYLADVPGKRAVTRRYVRADIGEQRVDCLDDDDGITEWSKGDYFPRILLDFVASGRARVGPVGDCTAELLSAPAFVEFAVDWIETNLGPEMRAAASRRP